MAVSAEMILPGLAGWWLDGKTGWYGFAVAGFAVGLVVGVTHLIVMTRPLASQGRRAIDKRREMIGNSSGSRSAKTGTATIAGEVTNERLAVTERVSPTRPSQVDRSESVRKLGG